MTTGFTDETRRFLRLLWAITGRDIRARYRRTILGPLWAILQPLMLMVVFTALSGVLDIPSDNIPYVIFSYSALTPWTFFANSVSRCGPSIISNASIIKKTPVSRELFPMVAVTTAGFDTLMAGIILAVMMVWYQVSVDLSLVFWLPVLTLLTAVFALGVGMFFAALGVYKRDLLQVNAFVLQLWIYATPVIYPLSEVPDKWQALYKLNPMVGLLEGFRSVLARGETPDVSLLLWGLPVNGLVLLIAWPLFRYTSRYFADVL
ncbi:MAG: ABC transporter permease [Anaerolineae bacterium]|nr:MAG: ABC transporter permease [Anaerolineae bacterium]